MSLKEMEHCIAVLEFATRLGNYNYLLYSNILNDIHTGTKRMSDILA